MYIAKNFEQNVIANYKNNEETIKSYILFNINHLNFIKFCAICVKVVYDETFSNTSQYSKLHFVLCTFV